MNDIDETEEGSNQKSDSRDVAEITTQAAWSGPLPPPAILEQFNNVVENGAERIFSAWEGETKHRHTEEKRELSLYARDSILGKIFAFVFVILALICSLYAAVNGSEVFATVLGGGTIASVVWAFVKVNRRDSNSDE